MTSSLKGPRPPDRSDLSARPAEGFDAWLDRVRRVALPVADLAGDEPPLGEEHILVALALRAPGEEGPGAWHEPVASYGTPAEARPW